MGSKNQNAAIEPVRLSMNSTFQFRCHPGVPCFTRCCRGIRITLTPYDIIRLKTRLELGSKEFLAIYTEPQLLEKTDLPMVTLKLVESGEGGEAVCPFLREDGCIVYKDRPTTCRYYPLGVATLSHQDQTEDEGFFFFVNEPHCLGFQEAQTQTVREWRRDQGVDRHDEINEPWTQLVVRKRSFPPNIKLTEQAKQMFFMVSYDIDTFRRFVFDSSFLKRIAVDEATLAAIQDDDVALLRFGLDWLESLLFKQRNYA